ncbi:hypothetical protein MTR_7g064960 [Medicago truncatula]|uniref:Uncharacterized protein n=1 Tax=Medicago truncatula TaxID=3880 RepID=G7L5J9_MEDTR|nr:hypothetical protein MTR_7g064960 [Medicago truncatula]
MEKRLSMAFTIYILSGSAESGNVELITPICDSNNLPLKYESQTSLDLIHARIPFPLSH